MRRRIAANCGSFSQAAEAISRADALLFAAGAGMGVDSGLPDFRGNEGFWNAYPPFAELGLSFAEVANPHWFDSDPEMAWGFYGHRLKLYHSSTLHAGYVLLQDWARSKPNGFFVFTSNVDGHFQKAGFSGEPIVECHGSIDHLQCTRPCCEDIWPAGQLDLEVDEETLRAGTSLPSCARCGALARPNILMFGDGRWIWERTRLQEERFQAWQNTLAGKELTIIECGAGTAVPSVRSMSEELQASGATLVRINSREPQGPPGTISIGCGALEALQEIHKLLEG